MGKSLISLLQWMNSAVAEDGGWQQRAPETQPQ